MAYCSTGCRVITTEMTAAHHVIATVGVSDRANELLDSAQALEAAWERLQAARKSVRFACREAGWTPAQAAALLAGRITAERVGNSP